MEVSESKELWSVLQFFWFDVKLFRKDLSSWHEPEMSGHLVAECEAQMK